jgi:hypothetical protein
MQVSASTVAFDYKDPLPSVRSVTPLKAPPACVTTLTLTGADLDVVNAIQVGGRDCMLLEGGGGGEGGGGQSVTGGGGGGGTGIATCRLGAQNCRLGAVMGVGLGILYYIYIYVYVYYIYIYIYIYKDIYMYIYMYI